MEKIAADWLPGLVKEADWEMVREVGVKVEVEVEVEKTWIVGQPWTAKHFEMHPNSRQEMT